MWPRISYELWHQNQKVLRDTNDAFAQLLERRKDLGSRIEIKAFHEEIPISNVGMVVSSGSASLLEYTSEGHTCKSYGSIFSYHQSTVRRLTPCQDMAKFASSHDNGYEKVIGTLLRWTKKTPHPVIVLNQDGVEGSVCPGPA